jgi:signal transduction histidine kinase
MANLFRLNPFNFISDSGPERFAVGRVNILLARIFSIGGLAVGVQMLLNAWSQRFIINPWLFWPGFVAVSLGQAGLIYGAYFSGRNSFWQRWYARSIALVIITWFLGFPGGGAMPPGIYPWAWWGVGLAAVAAFAGLPPIRAITFFVSLDVFWFVARFFPAYGAVDVWLNLQDTVLTFLFAAVLGSLVMVTRYEASKVDEASTRKIAAATGQARAEAEIREKSRLDALVHDKVLTTLLMAAKARSPQEQAQAAELAVSAVTALNASPSFNPGTELSGTNFFEALEKITSSQKPDLVISRGSVEIVMIPEPVATALTEATLQAIVNSEQHAGQNAVTELHLKAHRDGVKIVVKDNGRGFRLSRVAKNRLGIRISIIERVEMVGGRAFVDSRPGAGCNIILEWPGHA